LVCYCFLHRRSEIETELRHSGISTVGDRIADKVQARECECEVRKPVGPMLPRRGESGDRPAAHFPAGFRSLLTEALIDRGLPAAGRSAPPGAEWSPTRRGADQLGKSCFFRRLMFASAMTISAASARFSGLRRLLRLCSHVGGDCRLRPFELLLVGSLVCTEIPPLLFRGG